MNQKELSKIACLARIHLSESEQKKMAKQLDLIFKYFNKISSVQTKNTKPLVHPLEGLKGDSDGDEKIHLRKDKQKSWEKCEELLDLAPELLGREHKVPLVLD